MPFSFPSSPAVGATSTQNGRQYVYAGNNVWQLAAVSGEDSVLRALFVPPAPTSVTATAGNAQATVSWTAPTVLAQTPITDHTLQYSSNSGSSWTTFTAAASTATSSTITGLTNSSAYVFRVAAVNAVGVGAFSTASSSVTPTAGSSPGAPTGLAATAGNAQIALSWTAPANIGSSAITGYSVEYTPSGGSPVTVSTGSTATSYTITSLTNGTAYTARVAAVNSVGTGSFSTASSSVTPAIPSDDLFGSVSLLLHMDGTGSSFTDSSVTPKTLTANGSVTQSAAQSKFGGKSAYFDGNGDYLTIPANSAFSFPGDFTIEFWVFLAGNPNSYAGSYGAAIVNCYSGNVTPNPGWQVRINGTSSSYTTINLYTGNNDLNFAYTFAQNQWHHVAISRVSSVIRAYANGNQVGSSITNSDTFTPSASNALSIGRLALESTYLFDINGYIDDLRITKAGRFAGSTITVPTAAFPDSGPMSAPTSLAATGGNAQVSLTWTAPAYNGGSSITDYSVQYSTNSGSTWTTVSRTASTTASQAVTGLTNGTAYVFRVAGINSNGTGTYTAASSSVTPSASTDSLYSYVSLLLNFDGSNGQKSYTDESSAARTLTSSYHALSTAEKKFGSASLKLDGTGAVNTYDLAFPAGTFPSGTQSFCVEFWFYGTQFGIQNYSTVNDDCFVKLQCDAGSTNFFLPGAASSYGSWINLGYASAWQHTALVRDGSAYRVYVNGTQVRSGTMTASFPSESLSLYRRREGDPDVPSSGYIDSLRVTLGHPRYTSNFSAPTAAFAP